MNSDMNNQNSEPENNQPQTTPPVFKGKKKKQLSVMTAVLLCIAIVVVTVIASLAVLNDSFQAKIDGLQNTISKLTIENKNLKDTSVTDDDYINAYNAALSTLSEAQEIVKNNYVFYNDEELGVDEEKVKAEIAKALYNIIITKKADVIIPIQGEDGEITEEASAIEITKDNVEHYLLDTYFDNVPDMFTIYHTPEEVKEMQTTSQGKLYGIGVYVTLDIDNGFMHVNHVMPNSPAEKVGIKQGDRIKSVNGVTVTPETYADCVASVAGPLNTEVPLVILRDGKDITFKPKRGEVKSKAVYTEYKGDYAWISVIEFSGNVAEDFIEAMEEARKKNVKGYIFDMRDNPGGDLNIICDVLDCLLPEGPIVNIMDVNHEKVYSRSSDAKCVEAPMTVLCNGNTASAGELFTSALKDYKKATIIGTKTYGKGTMQSIIWLARGGAVRVSTNYYNPPFSENYHHKGIEPDIILDESDYVKNRPFLRGTDNDVQLAEAIKELDRLNNK